MGPIEIAGIVVIVGFISGIIIWSVRLEGKLKAQEIKFEVCFDNIKEDISSINSDIGKIFDKIEELVKAVSGLVEYKKGVQNGIKRREKD